jgi:RNA polymerase sigma-70 factor (ECF subfamily)
VEHTDAEIIARVLVDDDPRAYTQLVERHQSPVRGLLRRLTRGDDTLGDELAQETFLQAYRHLRSFRAEARFSTWLFRIAYHAFLAHARSRRDHERFDEDFHADATASTATASDLRHDLEFAMQKLSIPERTVLTLCLGEGFTHEEAADVLELPLGSVKTHLLRGREKLRTLLAEWETR